MTGTRQAAPLYLDCDTGIDDALALAYILSSPQIELKGIGTVSGNTSAEQAATNTLKLLELAGRTDIPVAVGCHDFTALPFDGGAPHVHGDNGVGDVVLPDTRARSVPYDAPQMLIDLAEKYDGELEVLAIGPLTNLAEALRRKPSLAGQVKNVTVMGGAVLVPGNVSSVAEANIANDPEAASLVLSASWPVTLVPLDITMTHVFEEDHRIQLLESGAPFLEAIGHMLDGYFSFYTQVFGRRACALHDPLAAALAAQAMQVNLAPKLSITVDTSRGPNRGRTVCDISGTAKGLDRIEPSCRVVLSVEDQLAHHFVPLILAHPWPLFAV